MRIVMNGKRLHIRPLLEGLLSYEMLSQVLKSTEFANARPGFEVLQSKLEQLGVSPGQVLIGLEATSRYGENLYLFLENHGLSVVLTTSSVMATWHICS
jgi:transposase